MIEYASDVFDRATVEAATSRWIRILEAAVADVDQRIGEIDLLDSGERDRVLLAWNDSDRVVPQAPLPELLSARAAESPNLVAVECDGTALTYRELDERANQLAHHLAVRGAGPDSRVGLCVGRSVDMIVGLVGILKAGAAYVPIDPTHPADRIRFILDDSRITTAVTEERFRDLFDAPVLLDSDPVRAHPTTALDTGVTPDNLAYVVYTSGSTGLPKGIAMSGRCVVNMLAWQRIAVAGGPGARTAQFTALTFDVHVQEVVAALLDGETLVVATDDVRRDPVAFTRWLADESISRLFVPNVMIRAICDQANLLGVDLGALRHISQAGEPLLLDSDVRALCRKYPELRIHNHYGPPRCR